MNSQEEALIAEVIGQLVSKIVQLKTENKQLKSQLEGNPPEKKVHKSVQTSEKPAPKRYIFGKATIDTINEYKDFVQHCINKEGKFEMSPEKVAVWLGISSRARDTYLASLKAHKINDKPIIVEISGQYYSNFSKEVILEEFFKELDD